MKTNNLKTGCLGEEIAKRYLENQGYRIIQENYRTKYAEIDLIAWHKKCLVFIEVRTKKEERFGTPEESLTVKKINKLLRNAMVYTAQRNYQGSYRIDAVCIVLDGGQKLKRLKHYSNISLPLGKTY